MRVSVLKTLIIAQFMTVTDPLFIQAAPLLVLLLAHQHLGQNVPGIEVRPFSDHILSLSKFSPYSLYLQVHRAALAAHAQAEGRLEEQERREQGLKDEVPGIQVKDFNLQRQS